MDAFELGNQSLLQPFSVNIYALFYVWPTSFTQYNFVFFVVYRLSFIDLMSSPRYTWQLLVLYYTFVCIGVSTNLLGNEDKSAQFRQIIKYFKHKTRFVYCECI